MNTCRNFEIKGKHVKIVREGRYRLDSNCRHPRVYKVKIHKVDLADNGSGNRWVTIAEAYDLRTLLWGMKGLITSIVDCLNTAAKFLISEAKDGV